MANILPVQTAHNNSGASYVNSLNLIWPGNTVTGDYLSIAIVASEPSATVVSTVTDSQSNTWTKRVGLAGFGGQNLHISYWECVNCTGGTTPTITITLTAGKFNTISAIADEFSGITTSTPFDVYASNTEANASNLLHSCGTTGATAQNNDLVLAYYATTTLATLTAATPGYVAALTEQNATQFSEIGRTYVIATSAATQTANISSSAYSQGIGIIVTVKGSAATASFPQPYPPTMVAVATAHNRAFLSWNAPSNVGIASFKVKRSTTAGSGYSNVATGVTTSYYDDTSVSDGTTYYYVIVATSSGGDSDISSEVTAVVATNTAHGAQWYANGSAPIGISTSTLYGYLTSKWNRCVSYMWTQSGATQAGLGAWRVQVPDQTFYSSNGTATYNATVSEGIGYGMISACYMSNPTNPSYDIKAKSYFHGFLLYYKQYKNAKGLMNWHINSAGVISDFNGATDGDMDAAFACFMMHRLWGSNGSVNYYAEGLAIAQSILDYEFVPAAGVRNQYANLINNGDGWDPYMPLIYPDYFSAAYCRIFQYHMGSSRWNDIINANYALIPTYYLNTFHTGFVPDGSYRDGTKINNGDTYLDGSNVRQNMVVPSYDYGYNSIRIAWRLHLDWLWNGNTIAGNSMKNLANLVNTKAQGSAENLHAQPNLSWTSDAGYANQVFVSGYASICCSQSTTAPLASTLATYINSKDSENSYFGLMQGLMNLLLLSGEFVPTFGSIPANPTTPSSTTSAAFLLNML